MSKIKSWKVLAAMVMVTMVPAAGYSHGPGDSECHQRRQHREPLQVIQEHIQAISDGDWALAACDYAEDAVVQTDFGTFRGRDQVMAAKQALLQAFPQLPNVTRLTAEDDVVFLTFNILTPGASIPDGVDTYVIRHGQIRSQTAHGLVTFGP